MRYLRRAADSLLAAQGLLSLVGLCAGFALDLETLFQSSLEDLSRELSDRRPAGEAGDDTPLRVIADPDLARMPTRHRDVDRLRSPAEVERLRGLGGLDGLGGLSALVAGLPRRLRDGVRDSQLRAPSDEADAVAGGLADLVKSSAEDVRTKKDEDDDDDDDDDDDRGDEEEDERDGDAEGDVDGDVASPIGDAEDAVDDLGELMDEIVKEEKEAIEDAIRKGPEPYWHHPCGRSVDLIVRRRPAKGESTASSAKRLTRHINKALERVWQQLNMSVLHYRLQRFDKLYYKVVIGVNEDHYIPTWVPDKKDLPIPEHIKSSQQLAHHLTRMHTQLQKFSVALEQIAQDEKDDPLRHNALFKTQSYVKMLLCEVEWALLSLAIPLPDPVPRDIMTASERGVTDSTNRQIRDWGVLLKYRDFLRGWSDIVSHVTHGAHAHAHADAR